MKKLIFPLVMLVMFSCSSDDHSHSDEPQENATVEETMVEETTTEAVTEEKSVEEAATEETADAGGACTKCNCKGFRSDGEEPPRCLNGNGYNGPRCNHSRADHS